MKKAVVMTVCLGLVMVVPAHAADRSYMQLADKFMKSVKKGEGVAGMDEIYATNPWMERAKDALDNVKTQFQGLPELVGSYNGHTLLVEKTVANRLAYLNYLVAYDRQPIRFEFIFYRPDKEWVLLSFSFDDEIDSELQERGRYEALLAQE